MKVKKTFHRKMYELLDYEDYKALISNDKDIYFSDILTKDYEHCESSISYLLLNSFDWEETKQGYVFWADMYINMEVYNEK